MIYNKDQLNMNSKRIKLDTLKNTRDLGGIETTDGHFIRPHKLIRSGQLSDVSEKDYNLLINDYDVKTVIDLRTEAEIQESPDNIPEGIAYFRLPLLDSSFLGIARDEFSMKCWLNVFKDSDEKPEEVFSDMYQKLVFGDRSKKYIRDLFDILLTQEDGSVLWHCSAGKDRVGITTLLILSALNVSREVIIEDYMATEKFLKNEIIKGKILGPLVLKKKSLMDCFQVLLGVREEYIDRIYARIDKEYGNTANFLLEQFGLTTNKINKLRNKYLI